MTHTYGHTHRPKLLLKTQEEGEEENFKRSTCMFFYVGDELVFS